MTISVNVSPVQLLRPDLTTVLRDVFKRTGVDPTDLVLEVTEGVLIDDAERALAVLGRIRDLGVRLALDDFGTGFSSLNYLRQLPVDIIKIDRSFIANMDGPPAGRAIVAGVTDLAHTLGHMVVAEGVETRQQRDQVKAIGCDAAQGFFFTKAVPATAITSQLLGLEAYQLED